MKATIGGVALIALALAALAGTGTYLVLRHMEKRAGTEAGAAQEIDAVKARFASRPPLVEITDWQRGDIRINRSTEASSGRVDTVHIINWRRDTAELIRTDVPLWLMRFSTFNIASQLGIAPAKFRLTVGDIERYGPGVVIDYGSAGAFRFFAWVD